LLKQKSKEKVKEIFDDLNWHEEHLKTNLDFKITPLTQAAYLGRKKIIEFILENYNNVDLNLATKQNSYTALSAACMAGNYDIVCLLTEYGADVNKLDSTEKSTLIYCYSRLNEDENYYENKALALKMAD